MKKTLHLLIIFLFTIPFALKAQTIEFSDDFESGSNNWTLEGAWGITNSQANNGMNSLTDSPNGDYSANLNISATLTNSIDLSSALDANLSFFTIYDIEDGNFDYCYVEASADGGTTWLTIASIFGQGNLSPWIEHEYSIGGLVGSNDVKIRFRFFADGAIQEDGIYIDDVVITSSNEDTSAPLIVHTPPVHYEGTSEDFTLEAELIDASGIAAATLSYSVDGSELLDIEGANLANDIYTFIIPAQAAGSQVDYSISVVDSSPAANTETTPIYSYISGNHLFYDSGMPNMFTRIGPTTANNVTRCAVRYSLSQQNIKYALIGNYTDDNDPNNDFEFHIWSDNDGEPGADMITPFTVSPEATLEFSTGPMTRIDLRDFSEELSNITGDVFIGFVVNSEKTTILETVPGAGGQTFIYSAATGWGRPVNQADYHIRVVTGETPVGVENEIFFQKIRLFPNPARSQATIEYNFEGDTNLKIKIRNSVGQIIREQDAPKGKLVKFDIDLSSFSNGIYFIELNDGIHQLTHRLVVSK